MKSEKAILQLAYKITTLRFLSASFSVASKYMADPLSTTMFIVTHDKLVSTNVRFVILILFNPTGPKRELADKFQISSRF